MTNNISHPSEFINVVLIPKWENDAVNEVHLLVLFSDGRKIFILFIFRALEPQNQVVSISFGLAIMIISGSDIMLLDNVISISYIGN